MENQRQTEASTGENTQPEHARQLPPGQHLPILQQQPFLQYLGAQPQLPPPPNTQPPVVSGSQSTLARSSSDGQEDHHLTTHAKPKRNPRQQEQNKQAQQRYRAKRKAQFEEMQSTVQVLTQQVQTLERENRQARTLQAEIQTLQALLRDKDAALAAAAAEAQRLRGGGSNGSGGGGGHPAAALALPQDVSAAMAASAEGVAGTSLPTWAAAAAPGPSLQLAQAAPPLPATAEVAAAAALAGPGGGVPAAGSGAAAAPASNGGGAAAAAVPAVVPTPTLIQHALQMYYHDLQQHAVASHLEYLHPSGRDASPETLRELQRLLQAGTELIKMVLQASGPGAEQLLLGSAAGAAIEPVLPSPADNHHLWQQVAVRLQLSAEQARDIGAWKGRFIQSLDEIYGQRLLLKAQVVQMSQGRAGNAAAGGGITAASTSQPHWAESVLLQAVSSQGYSASAHAAVELEGLLDSLRDNIRQERAMAGDMMQTLLTRLLTPVQAARFLLAGHPFTWNGLAFAHSLASMSLPPTPTSQLLGPPALP